MEEINDWDFDNWKKEFISNDINPLIEKGRKFLNVNKRFNKEGYNACFEIGNCNGEFKLTLLMEKNGKC